MQPSVMRFDVGFDNVTEVTLPVVGVVLRITPVSEYEDGGTDFVLTVSDLDTSEVFKSIESRNLRELIDRQHQLVLAFAE